MAIASSMTLQAAITGLIGSTSRNVGPLTTTNSAPTDLNAGTVTTVVLGSGANTITPPVTTCAGCIIIFAAASTVTKTIKGVTGDTGVLVAPAGWIALSFAASAPSSFVITTSGADTGNTTTIHWI